MGQLVEGVGCFQVDVEQAAVVVFGGDDQAVGAGLGPAVVLGLVAQDEQVRIEHNRQAVQRLLAVPASPGQQVDGVGTLGVFNGVAPAEDPGIKAVDEGVGRQGMGSPDPVFAPDGQRLGKQVVRQPPLHVLIVLAELPPHGVLHGLVHLFAVLEHLAAADHRRIVVAEQDVDLAGMLNLALDSVHQELVGKAASEIVLRAAVNDLLEDQVGLGVLFQVGIPDDALEVAPVTVEVAREDQPPRRRQADEVAPAVRVPLVAFNSFAE